MHDTSSAYFLMIEPTGAASAPVEDELTAKVRALFAQSRGNLQTRGGFQICTGAGCRAMGDVADYTLPNGMITNSLCVHYISEHRKEVPQSELAKLNAMTGTCA